MISSPALCSNRERFPLMEESLSEVFRYTVRSTTKPRSALRYDAVITALEKTDGAQQITGVNINGRGGCIEVSYSNEAGVDDLLGRPLKLPDQPPLHFQPSYDDSFVVTFYNVPLCSTGDQERQLLMKAGATVTNQWIVKRRLGDNDVNTGERRYKCTGKNKFTYVPELVKLYEGRILVCRYRGQAKDLATKQPTVNTLPTACIWGRHNDAFMQQPSRSRTSTLDSIRTTENPPTPTTEQPDLEESLPDADPPPPLPAAPVVTVEPTSPVRAVTDPLEAVMDPIAVSGPLYVDVSNTDSISASASPVRKPAKSGPPDLLGHCSHVCLDCDEDYPTTIQLNNHQMAVHPTLYATDYRTWQQHKAIDVLSYRKEKQMSSCPRCHGFLVQSIRHHPP